MNVLPADRNQSIIFNSIDDFVPENSPVRFLEILIDTIIFNNKNKYLSKGSSNLGRPAYSTETLLKIYLYGYLNRITSSRRLENECNRNLELIWLTGNLRPDFKTIADFRKDNPNIIEQFAKDLRKIIKGLGLFDTQTIIIDSTKLKANASKKLDRRDEVVKRLFDYQIEFENYVKKLNDVDKEEEEDSDIDLFIKRKEYLEKEILRLKNKIKKMDDFHKNYISETDPDCYLTLKYGSFFPAYHMQVLTEPTNNFIVNEYLSDYNNDLNELPVLIEKIKEEFNETPKEIIADTGYSNLDIINEIEDKQLIECIVTHHSKKKKSEIEFIYDKNKDVIICSEGKELKLKHKNKKEKKSYVNLYLGKECQACNIKDKCTSSKIGRSVSIYWNQEFRDKHKMRMEEKINKEKFKLRKSSVEHIFGTIKQWLGYIPILTRGKEKVTSEIKLISISYNIKRLMNIININDLKEKMNYIYKNNIALKQVIA